MDEIIKEYVLELLQYQQTRLECINIGFAPDKRDKAEISLIEMAKKKIEEKL